MPYKISRLPFFLMLFPIALLMGEESFLLLDTKTSRALMELGPSLDERMTPCSSFKIALCLMGFDAKVLTDDREPTWEFREGYVDSLASWRAAQSPGSWIANSCVWYSQRLAEELGLEKIDAYLALFDYGNREMSGGLTEAWLSSSLKISPREQVKFLQKLARKALPVSEEAMERTRALLSVGDLPDEGELFGKTGLGREGTRQIGWFVGWVEREGEVLAFAYVIRDDVVETARRVPRVKELLAQTPRPCE